MSLGESFGLAGRTALVVGGDTAIRDVVASALTNAGAATSSVPCESFDPNTPAKSGSADIVVLNCCLSRPTDEEGGDQSEPIARLAKSLVAQPLAAIEKFAPVMRPDRWGRIIFLTPGDEVTLAAVTAHGTQTALIQAKALQLASDGITVNRVIVGARSSNGLVDWQSALASAVHYFASDESSFVTGQTLRLDCSVARN